MRSKMLAAAIAGAAVLVWLLPADAATKKRPVAARGEGTVVVSKDESGRSRTRIVIQRRSFLDAGTEVLPGERKFTDYVYPPNYSVTSVIDNTAFWHRSPLPGPWDLPSKNNPGQLF